MVVIDVAVVVIMIVAGLVQPCAHGPSFRSPKNWRYTTDMATYYRSGRLVESTSAAGRLSGRERTRAVHHR